MRLVIDAPDEWKERIEQIVKTRLFKSSQDYVRELIRADMESFANKRE